MCKKMCDEQHVPSELSRKNPCFFDICCFCIPTKIGCFILAYIQLISFIFGGIVSVRGIFTGWALMVYRSNEQVQTIGKYTLITYSVLIVLIIISLPFTIVLLVGLHKDNRKLIKVYLVYAVICLAISTVFYMTVVLGTQAFILEMLWPMTAIAINIYFLLVFRSHHLKLKWDNANVI